jgi:hypothetical protein
VSSPEFKGYRRYLKESFEIHVRLLSHPPPLYLPPFSPQVKAKLKEIVTDFYKNWLEVFHR